MRKPLRIAVLLLSAAAGAAFGQAGPQRRVIVDLAGPGHGFRPDEAFGGGVDGAQQGDIDRLFTAHNMQAMRGAGLQAFTYRLRTELGVEAWHWNPVGTWSDAAHNQGYWTSSDRPGPPIQLSWGYKLPRRGDTQDNANNNDWSRLTDGDRATFWKSNPYLDPQALKDGEDHPQWLWLRLERTPIDAIRIDWADPYAVGFEVQYWTGRDDGDPSGKWITFPHGKVADGHGGSALLRLADTPIPTGYVRVLLHAGSHTAPPGSTDWRDRMGYAVREVSVGKLKPNGELEDVVRHVASHDGQTFTHVSSTDPWHRAVDRDPDLEQVGFDRLFASGLTFGKPAMVPTDLLFGTPENAEAELRYLARRGYPISRIELGEEADGQYASPADYGALYLQAVDRLKGILPGAALGGPSLQSAYTETVMLPDQPRFWNQGFVDYLKRRGRLGDLGFVSFEYYPFDDICGDIHAKLIEQTGLMAGIMERFAKDGVPAATPKVIAEYGFSAYSGRAMSEMPSALLMAGVNGQWLSQGGAAAYLFGYTPNWPANQHQACAGFGNMMTFMADPNGQATQPMPSYYTARLLTQAWTMPGHGLHRILPVETGDPAVKAYAVRRPDHRLGLLLINRSGARAFTLPLAAKGADGRVRPLAGPIEYWRYGPSQYAWKDAGEDSKPIRDLPPEHGRLARGAAGFALPADTVAVVLAADPG
jgi:hypothetical protein